MAKSSELALYYIGVNNSQIFGGASALPVYGLVFLNCSSEYWCIWRLFIVIMGPRHNSPCIVDQTICFLSLNLWNTVSSSSSCSFIWLLSWLFFGFVLHGLSSSFPPFPSHHNGIRCLPIKWAYMTSKSFAETNHFLC